MKIKAMAVLVPILVFSGLAMAKKKAPAPCVVYFAVVENDQTTVHLSMVGLNKAQSSWYEKHGNRDKYAGVCYVAKASDAPADAPLYAIVWGEHSVSEPYTWTSQTTEQVRGTATDENGNRSTVTMDVPVTKTDSGVVNYRTADGWLAVWDQKANNGKGNFIPKHRYTAIRLHGGPASRRWRLHLRHCSRTQWSRSVRGRRNGWESLYRRERR